MAAKPSVSLSENNLNFGCYMHEVLLLFIQDLLNNIVSNSDYIALNGRILNNILDRMWEEAVMAQSEILSWHLAGMTGEGEVHSATA
jgi:hypothetical protein